MPSTARPQRRYDHRLRDLVCTSQSMDLATRHGVPRSTARGWLAPTARPVVTLDALNQDIVRLQRELLALRQRVARLTALLRLPALLLRLAGTSLYRVQIAEGAQKPLLLHAIARARAYFSLRALLRLNGLSHARYHAWQSEAASGLPGRACCPRRSPQQLTLDEVNAVREMVTSDQYRHVPTGRLACLAQRLGRVIASPTTWRRLVQLHRWRRPRQRVHPAQPKVGVRAARPNEVWHVDTTIIRLLDGSRVYLRAVLDNFSRRILAWRVVAGYQPEVTAQLLAEAQRNMATSTTPTALVDGGSENFNGAVDELVQSGALKRLLAQTDVQFSNSLIEAWWRVLMHQWLYLNALDSAAAVRKLVAFYVEQHNAHLPHAAFQGQTPDEMYFGTGGDVPQQLAAAKAAARQARLTANRALRCQTCSAQTVIAD